MFKNLFKRKEKGPADHYLKYLDRVFGDRGDILRISPVEEGGMVVFVYKNFPEKGLLTGVTYGLSLQKHPAWVNGRPELIITVESKDDAWAHVAGHIAHSLRGDCPFSYGNTINFGQKVADDSEMDAFLVFAPAAIDKDDYLDIDIGLDYKISLAGLYPIYSGELKVIEEIGLKEFWHHPGFDVYTLDRLQIRTHI